MAAGNDTMKAEIARLDKKIDALANSTKMQFEAMREDIKKLGEGYESGFKEISRQIQNLNKTWMAKWSIHDAALKNHAERITTLEHHDSNRGDQ